MAARCWQCLQYRATPQKLPASFVATASFGCWRHVMIDCEGPSSPPDQDGYRFVVSYMRIVCGE
eukprot:5510075-Alexandrium_andersonii.AAC.1